MKKIGIGISDFETLRSGGYLFIDKTLLIQEVLDTGAQVLLIPRPRRFGKTLNLSMLRSFFLVLPRGDRSRPAVILEMKSIAGFYQEETEKAMEEAVEQIRRRAYGEELRGRGFSRLIKVAVVSDGKRVWVREV